MEYIVLTFALHKEGKYLVSRCLELGTASFGRTHDEALENLSDATEVYLNTLEDLGEARIVLKEKGVKIYSFEPASINLRSDLPPVRVPTGTHFESKVMPLSKVHA